MRERGKKDQESPDLYFEGRREYEMDIDRMVNEGLGGGNVTPHNGLIGHSTTDAIDAPDGVAD